MKFKIANPSPSMVRAARESAGMTQTDAAGTIGLTSYQRWADYERGIRAIDDVKWEMFLLRTGQHPELTLEAR